MKKHVGAFGTVTEGSASDARRVKRHRHSQRERRGVTVLDKSHRGRNALILASSAAGAGAGITAAAIEMFQFNWLVQLVWHRTRCRGRHGGIGGVSGRRAGVGADIPSHPTIYRAGPANSNTPHGIRRFFCKFCFQIKKAGQEGASCRPE